MFLKIKKRKAQCRKFQNNYLRTFYSLNVGIHKFLLIQKFISIQKQFFHKIICRTTNLFLLFILIFALIYFPFNALWNKETQLYSQKLNYRKRDLIHNSQFILFHYLLHIILNLAFKLKSLRQSSILSINLWNLLSYYFIESIFCNRLFL